jgi:predicted TIM-barrel fold metal-dependent hydrolase
MRVVALEEHFTVPAVVAKYIKPEMTAKRGHYKGRKVAPGKASPMELLPEFGEKRFKSLDDAGITVQVLSNSGPAPDLVPGADGVSMAREINDHLAGMVAKNPKRFAGFAALPMAKPAASADE